MWEKIDAETSRMWVPGGWLVRSKMYAGNDSGPGVSVCVHVIFVSDIGHDWEFEK